MNLNSIRRWWIGLLLAIVVSAPVMSSTAAEPDDAERNTPLDEYVAREDPTYEWKVVNRVEDDEMTTFVIDMKSQTWRTPDEIDRTVWQHWLTVARPKELTSDIGFVLIGGGRNGGDPPSGAPDMVKMIAEATGTVVAELRMIPNQPLTFHQDGKGRVEDDLIAYCWDQFLKTNDPTWLPRFPMAKSVVRAMDTIETLTASEDGGGEKVKRFVVAGGSKRGWTTWITAVVDKRVVAISPIVIDVLNTTESMLHHFYAYGYFAPAVWDYVRHDIMPRMRTPEMEALRRHVDPYVYRDRLTMPKYIVNATGDEFFLPDSSRFYFDDLKGEKHLRYVPNGSHSLSGTDARESITAFYWAVVNDKARPKYDWSFADDGSIHVTVEDKPVEVNLWQATNPNARDFRLDTIGKAYEKTGLSPTESGEYVAQVEQPEKGFRAYFVELVYDIGAPYPLKVTTGVRVTPDELPFADKDPTTRRKSRRKK